MSRIGKKPIEVPADIKVSINVQLSLLRKERQQEL